VSTRTLTNLGLLLLVAVVSVATIKPQTTADSKARKSFASDQERSSKSDKKDDWSRKEPRTGGEWFGRGYQLHSSDRYLEAIAAFQHAIDLGYRKETAMYNIACGYSLLNDKENAFSWLQRALDSGFNDTERLASDSDLDPLRTDQRFKNMRTTVAVADKSSWKVKGYKRDRLEEANLDYERLEREASQNGEEWSKVGTRLLLLRDLDRSVAALNKAVAQLDYKGSSAMYNLACAYALKGDRDSGIDWLAKSVNGGVDSPDKLQNDPDIATLRADVRFARIEKLSSTLSLSQFYNHDSNQSDSNYSRQRWAPAVELYSSFVKTEPNNGRAWFNLGYALHYSREHARAIEAFQHALALGYQKPTSSYDIACAYAMLNQKDAAFEWLDRAIKEGFNSSGDLSWDRDLDGLRSDPRFKRFIENAGSNTKLRAAKEYEW
jgi:tetratricopeptide (TPR) repeat protein